MHPRSWADGKKLDKKDGGYQWLYYTKRWKQRRKQQLTAYPLCAICLTDNYIKAANIVHHLVDHRGDEKLFYSSPLQSLCAECHNAIEYGVEHRGCDINGKPYATKPIYIDKNRVNRDT